jgi:hypothetical protein
MRVPDSITVGPNRATGLRLHQDNERLPIRMEVPDSIRLGKSITIFSINIVRLSLGNNDHMGLVNGTNSDRNHLLETTTQLSFPLSDIEAPSDEEYSPIQARKNDRQYQPIKIADS